MTQTTWATVDDVFTYTQVEVTTEALTVAGTTIDVFSARPYELDNTRVGSRDAYFLKLATCYQAAWLTTQFDYFTRLDRLTDGHSSTLTTYPEGAMEMGPVARRALKRVSWMKSRSLHVRTPFQDGAGVTLGMDPLSSALDSEYGWEQLGG